MIHLDYSATKVVLPGAVDVGLPSLSLIGCEFHVSEGAEATGRPPKDESKGH